ncbi:dynamin-related protein [Blattamonas nauphoetae]|uniref:Dynamin-related protein n=1 Tax=Blattamonas nauphoetae TaxID=2049346 RepID=A0ABQ9XP32_9EUKA|nr:dynamin-related protein [Blattamonas nauphoetae]
MEQLLTIMNKLMKVFAQANVPPIELPQIAVVGMQSAGKSSVLEAIVQRDFLPRGSGIVTRRPLVLHLVQTQGSSEEEWGEFGHLPGKRFSDFNEIRRQIELATDDVAGTGKAVSKKAIFLTINSPKVVNLILVDLPGLTKVAVGDQPKDIELQILDMIEEYIKSPRTIILAVSPGNVDIANSDALKLAHKWDPQGYRTLGVVTKLDLLDKGTDAADILTNKVIPLRLGYIGLCLRSQKDITENKSMKKALEDEEQFFRSHPAYASFSDKCGTAYLGKAMNQLLLHHISRTLPQIRTQIDTQLAQLEKDLNKFGPAPEEQGGIRSILLRLISDFSVRYGRGLDGDARVLSSDKGHLKGGARLSYVFKSTFAQDLDRTNVDLGMNDEQLHVQLRNSLGVNSSLFIPEKCFYELSQAQIERLRSPAIRCVDRAHTECMGMIRETLTDLDGINRFPQLRHRMMDEATAMLLKMKNETAEMVNNLISMEEAYINTKHPDFDMMGAVGEIIAEKKKQEQDQLSASSVFIGTLNADEDMKVEIIRRLVYMYYDIVRATIRDIVPKTIVNMLVNNSKENIQNELMRRMYKESLFSELMKEDSDVTRRRRDCLDRQRILREANSVLDDVSFASSSSVFDFDDDGFNEQQQQQQQRPPQQRPQNLAPPTGRQNGVSPQRRPMQPPPGERQPPPGPGQQGPSPQQRQMGPPPQGFVQGQPPPQNRPPMNQTGGPQGPRPVGPPQTSPNPQGPPPGQLRPAGMPPNQGPPGPKTGSPPQNVENPLMPQTQPKPQTLAPAGPANPKPQNSPPVGPKPTGPTASALFPSVARSKQ